MKKILAAFVILLSLLTACNSADNNDNETTMPEPSGYKPMIYYRGKLYGIGDPLKELPDNFIDSGDKIVAVEESIELPSKECYTTPFNAHNVGATIYIDPNDEDTICINEVGQENLYIMFRYREDEE